MQVVKTKIISLNFKLKQQHFELQPASVKDYSSCFQVAIFNKLLFPPMAFYFVKEDYQAIKAYYIKKGEACSLNRKRRYFGTFRAIPI